MLALKRPMGDINARGRGEHLYWVLLGARGDLQEGFAREIGRKVMAISGSISANNFILL